MFLPVWIGDWQQEDVLASQPENEQSTPRKRRGVTALEYLVMLSFIIVVVILAVQHIGGLTKGMFSKGADVTSKMNKK